jgi:hypothetical protein
MSYNMVPQVAIILVYRHFQFPINIHYRKCSGSNVASGAVSYFQITEILLFIST